MVAFLLHRQKAYSFLSAERKKKLQRKTSEDCKRRMNERITNNSGLDPGQQDLSWDR